MPVTSSYGVPGSATYSQDLGDLDHIMSALPDNTINQITAKNVRDSAFTMYNIIQGAIAANLYQVTSVGNTTSLPISIGGLQVSGTSSLYNNLGLLSTLSDITGSTGTNGYVITATNGGIVWTQPSTSGISATPSLQQVLLAGNTASRSYIMYGSGSFNAAAVFNGSTSSSWAVAITKSLILSSTIQDSEGKTGPEGYILAATSGGTVWIPNTGNGGGNLFQSTSLGNTTSVSIAISGTANPKYSILLSATMGSVMAFSGSISPTATYGSLKHTGLLYQDQSGYYNLNIPTCSNQSVYFPTTSGTISLVTQITLDNALLQGNTSTRFASIGSLNITSTASFGATVSITNGGLITVGITSSGYSNLNNTSIANLYISGTSTFVGTASFAKGIYDNYNSFGTSSSMLTIDNTGKVKWSTSNPMRINNYQTQSYTLVANDAGALVEIGASDSMILTVPPSVFNIGTTIDVTQIGTGSVTFAGGTGVTISSKFSYKTIATQYVVVSLIQRATNHWLLTGDLII